MEILLERDDIDPEKPNEYGQTPLWRAAFGGHEGVVKILLGCDDVNPNKPDNYGRTPLLRAAASERAGVVKILLGRSDVNPDKPDVYGQTPLFYATTRGSGSTATAPEHLPLPVRHKVAGACLPHSSSLPITYLPFVQ